MLWRSSVKNYQLALWTVLIVAVNEGAPADLDDVIDAVTETAGRPAQQPWQPPADDRGPGPGS